MDKDIRQYLVNLLEWMQKQNFHCNGFGGWSGYLYNSNYHGSKSENVVDVFLKESKVMPYDRFEGSIQGRAAIEFYEWMQATSMSHANVSIEIKWRMFADQKNLTINKEQQ